MDLHQLVDAVVDGGVVHIYYFLALLFVVGLVNGVLHFRHRLVNGDDSGEGEEGGLKDGVGAGAKTQFPGDGNSVDGIEFGLLLGQGPLHGGGEVLLQTLHVPAAVQQEGAALLEVFRHVVLADVRRGVAGHEVSGRNQVGRADGRLAEAQVALGQAAGLLGVVDEVRLAVKVRGAADDFDGVFVGAHGAVGAHAPDFRVGLPGGSGADFLGDGQGGEGHVVRDTDGEIVFRGLRLEIFVHGENLPGGRVLGAEAVAAADNLHGDAPLLIDGAHVLIQGLAHGAGLLGAVQNGDFLARGGNGVQEAAGVEGTVQVDVHKTDFFALGSQIIDSLLGGLGGGAHEDNDPLGVRRAVVVKEVVIPARQLVDLLHVPLHGVGDGGDLPVAGLPALEKDVRVDGSPSGSGVLGVQGASPEGAQSLHVHQRPQVLVVQGLDLLNLVGGAEAVEEVEEGHPAVNGRQMGHGPQVHDLLGRGGRQQGEAGGPHAHDVGVVAEDAEGVGGEGPGGDVEHAGEHLPRDFVHVGNHEEQALGGGVGGGQGPGLEGAVDGPRRAALGLHLHHLGGLAEEVLLPVGGPLVHVLRHG